MTWTCYMSDTYTSSWRRSSLDMRGGLMWPMANRSRAADHPSNLKFWGRNLTLPLPLQARGAFFLPFIPQMYAFDSGQ